MGNQLFREVTLLTGLPDELIGEELTQLLKNKGVQPHEMTIDSLRVAVEQYLREIDAEINAEADALEPESGS